MREQWVKPEKALRIQRLCEAKPFLADVRVFNGVKNSTGGKYENSY